MATKFLRNKLRGFLDWETRVKIESVKDLIVCDFVARIFNIDNALIPRQICPLLAVTNCTARSSMYQTPPPFQNQMCSLLPPIPTPTIVNPLAINVSTLVLPKWVFLRIVYTYRFLQDFSLVWVRSGLPNLENGKWLNDVPKNTCKVLLMKARWLHTNGETKIAHLDCKVLKLPLTFYLLKRIPIVKNKFNI